MFLDLVRGVFLAVESCSKDFLRRVWSMGKVHGFHESLFL